MILSILAEPAFVSSGENWDSNKSHLLVDAFDRREILSPLAETAFVPF